MHTEKVWGSEPQRKSKLTGVSSELGVSSWLVPVLWVGRLTGRASQPEVSLDGEDMSVNTAATEKISSDADQS